MTTTLGTQMKGFSENRVIFASIVVVAYNPLPLEDVLTTRFSGIVKFGVGRDDADDEAVKTFVPGDRTFLRR
jgi:hypothetical protein